MTHRRFFIRENGPHRYIDTDPDSTTNPVVLLHGMVGDVENWSETIRFLSDCGYRAIVPVLPVYTIRLADANLGGLVDYVQEFLEAMCVFRCVICGNSMGGQLAVHFTARYPDRVEQLILSGASGISEVDLGNSIMRRQDRAYLRDRIEKTFFDPAVCTEALLDEVIAIVNNRENVLRLVRFARSVQSDGVRDLLPQIQTPTLLIWGREDNITPVSVAHTLHDGIEESQLHVIDHCGHAPMMEHPEIFNRVVHTFLQQSEVVATNSIAV
ncbi:MAG: alpha/beta fold hydrolase [Rhodothermia bacterium]|nr:MAG: alpha/beta fold hydrolase [Rhodothermia bacterium]